MENDDNLKWLEKFNGPGKYKRYAEARGNSVSLQFGLGTSNIMKRFGITFSEACRLLMKEDYLFWVGGTPLYNMAGDSLWMTKEILEKLESISKEPAPPPKIESVFTSEPEISCVFYTLVIRDEPLNHKFNGGLEAFSSKYNVKYNNDIAVMLFMGPDDLEEILKTLENSGLNCEEDYTWFEASEMARRKPTVKSIPFKVKWLKGYCSKGRSYISLAK